MNRRSTINVDEIMASFTHAEEMAGEDLLLARTEVPYFQPAIDTGFLRLLGHPRAHVRTVVITDLGKEYIRILGAV